MAERIRFIEHGEGKVSFDEGMIGIVNRLYDLNWKSLHCCEGHVALNVYKPKDTGWGEGAYIPWDGEDNCGIKGHHLYVGGYISIYGTDIRQYGVPEYWYNDSDKTETCFDPFTGSFCICTCLRMGQVPFELKTKDKPSKDGLIRNKEIYEACIELKERALSSMLKWVETLPYNISDTEHHISEEEWNRIRIKNKSKRK